MILDKAVAPNISLIPSEFQFLEPASIGNCGKPSCNIARNWFAGMDRSHLISEKVSDMPVWLSENYKWGPNQWPLCWCSALKCETLDCAALSVLTHESFKLRGINSLVTQIVLSASDRDCAHWHDLWSSSDAFTQWISASVIYHQVCSIYSEPDQAIKVWDPSNNIVISPDQEQGYGYPIGIRVFSEDVQSVQWGSKTIDCNVWNTLSSTQFA